MKIHKVNDVDCADIAEECIEALDELDDEKVAALLATAIQASNEKTLRHMAFKAAVLAAFSLVCVGMFLLYALGTDAPWRMRRASRPGIGTASYVARSVRTQATRPPSTTSDESTFTSSTDMRLSPRRRHTNRSTSSMRANMAATMMMVASAWRSSAMMTPDRMNSRKNIPMSSIAPMTVRSSRLPSMMRRLNSRRSYSSGRRHPTSQLMSRAPTGTISFPWKST